MTAINIRVTPERATVWADGLSYKPDGTVYAIKHKVQRIGDWQAVMVFTGLAYVGERLAEILPTVATSFDDFRARRDLTLSTVMAVLQPVLDGSQTPRFAAFIVGWSDRLQAPELIAYDDSDGAGGGRIYTQTEILCPGLQEDEKAAVLLDMQRKGLVGKPAVRDIVKAVMEAQRRKRANPEFTKADAHFVGGHITETVIEASGITERVIHRWNDTVGEKVRPEQAFPANVTPLVEMSRQERRRAEKLAKKGQAA